MISRRGSTRRARAAALRPAATPPMTTRATALFPFFFDLLHKAQNIEGLELAVGVVAVDGILLVVEDLEDGGQLGHHQQLDGAAAEAEKLDVAAGSAQAGGDHYQRAETRAIDVIDVRH